MTLITLALAFLFMLLIVAGMAVGVACGRKPISGSCGGSSTLSGNMTCEVCGGLPARCDAGTVKKFTEGSKN